MKVLTLLAAATLLIGCEVNLNTEGLSARELKTFKITGQPEIVLDGLRLLQQRVERHPV